MNTPSQASSADLHPHTLISRSIDRLDFYKNTLILTVSKGDSSCPLYQFIDSITTDMSHALNQLEGKP